ncbi:MAG: DUF2786 domain-containing protein [Deltaproteobacteria bacterium]|jgi:hypothetical protein|nr:DUF2786 domain-containing protein [Deltaproteobacteria bacterium]
MPPFSSCDPRDGARLKTAFIRLLSSEHERLTAKFPGAKGARVDLRPLEGYWGRWLPQERTIAISESLLRQSRWAPACGILGHETAHQIVSDVYPAAALNETPHGPTFIGVCRRLSLDPYYWRASMTVTGLGSLPPEPRSPEEPDEATRPVLERVQKLLALAGSDNPNESAAALSAAERILSRHSLPPDAASGLPPEEAFRRLRIPLGTHRLCVRQSLIIHIMNEFFGVRSVYTWNYNPQTGEDERELELFGRPMNLAMGEYVWAFLNERCETLWQAYRPQARKLGEKGLSARNAFINSLLEAFAKKMREGRKAADAAPPPSAGPGGPLRRSSELALRKDRELEEYIGLVYPRLGTKTHSRGDPRRNPHAAGAGAEAGRKLSIHPPVAGGSSSGGVPAGRISG